MRAYNAKITNHFYTSVLQQMENAIDNSGYTSQGDAAQVFASVDDFLRQERNATRDAERADAAEVDELDARLDDLVARARREADAVIEAAGYHQHKRQWRRRRERRPAADR